MANEYMKKYSMSLAIKEMQIKMLLRFDLTPVSAATMEINMEIPKDRSTI
jgi:hypothetical protein